MSILLSGILSAVVAGEVITKEVDMKFSSLRQCEKAADVIFGSHMSAYRHNEANGWVECFETRTGRLFDKPDYRFDRMPKYMKPMAPLGGMKEEMRPLQSPWSKLDMCLKEGDCKSYKNEQLEETVEEELMRKLDREIESNRLNKIPSKGNVNKDKMYYEDLMNRYGSGMDSDAGSYMEPVEESNSAKIYGGKTQKCEEK